MTRWWRGKDPKNGAWLRQRLPTEQLQPHMFPGQTVKIVGLRSAFGVHLNGKEGTLKKYDALLGRWMVDVGSKEEGRSCIIPIYAKPWSLVPVVLRGRSLVGQF